MKKITFIKCLFLLFITVSSYGQTTPTAYYVSQEDGADSNDGLTATTPFKTLKKVPKTVASNGNTAFEIILMGTFVNDGYYSNAATKTKHTFTSGDIHDAFLWNSQNTLYFNKFKGKEGKYITIKAHDANTVLKGNGSNILRVQTSEYLIFKDLKIVGEVPDIPLSLANELQFAYLDLSVNEDADMTNDIDRYNPTLAQIRQRDEDCGGPGCDSSADGSLPKINGKPLARPSYVDTRGFYLSKINNIKILNNTITQMPGGGLRVSDAGDVDIIGNEVSYCSLRSFSGTHGLVVTKATSTRESTPGVTADQDYRIRIVGNKVHHNYNEQYSWAPDKDKITAHIDEGKGISLQRNQTTRKNGSIVVNWEHGRILVANNLTYFNGFSGVHSNDGDRVDFINNTSYFNSHTKSITEDDDPNDATFPENDNGGNIGISMSDGQDCKIINNISVIDSRMTKSAISVKQNTRATSTVTSAQIANGEPYVEIKNNIIYGTTLAGVVGPIDEGKSTTDIDTNTIMADPQFVDPANFDYRLKITSPAIDRTSITSTTGGLEIADTSANAPATDHNEDPRFGTPDMGALEFDANVTLWDGSESTTWIEADNWSAGVPVDNTYAINIPTGVANYPEITTANVALKDVYVNAGGTLNIAPNGSLTVERNLTQEGIFKIKSDASNSGSFILKGESKGTANVDYDRYVTTNWHLIASPVVRQKISDFSGFLAKNGTKYALAPYDNSLGTDLRYTYYTDGGANPIASAGSFVSGKGYTIKKTTADVLTFSGTLKTDDTEVAIADGVTAGVTGSNKWNMVGNPSTAYINLNDNADATNNFLKVNVTKLDPVRVAVYMWNSATSSYDIINHTDPSPSIAQYIAPGQSFFVQSIDGGATLNITEAMQSHQTGKFYKTTNTTPEIALSISSDKSTRTTRVKYLENTTTGLDPGYDAGTFTVNPRSFDVYTHLVANDEGHNFALQCLPNSDFETMVIPVGVVASKDTDVTFTSSALNLPSGINVYLEDKKANTFTRIDEVDSEYTVVLDEELNGIGRFYIHTSTTGVLDVNSFNVENVSIYTSDKNTLQIAGLESGKANVEIFDLIGKQVFTTSFKAKNLNTIKLPNFKTGIYIVNLQSEKGITSKKIVLE